MIFLKDPVDVGEFTSETGERSRVLCNAVEGGIIWLLYNYGPDEVHGHSWMTTYAIQGDNGYSHPNGDQGIVLKPEAWNIIQAELQRAGEEWIEHQVWLRNAVKQYRAYLLLGEGNPTREQVLEWKMCEAEWNDLHRRDGKT